jgi:hypothetical protein
LYTYLSRNSRLHAGIFVVHAHDTDQYFSNSRESGTTSHPPSIIFHFLRPCLRIGPMQITSAFLCRSGVSPPTGASSVLGGRLLATPPPTSSTRIGAGIRWGRPTSDVHALTWINRIRFCNTSGPSNNLSVPHQAQPAPTPSCLSLTRCTDLQLLQPYSKSSWGARP